MDNNISESRYTYNNKHPNRKGNAELNAHNLKYGDTNLTIIGHLLQLPFELQMEILKHLPILPGEPPYFIAMASHHVRQSRATHMACLNCTCIENINGDINIIDYKIARTGDLIPITYNRSLRICRKSKHKTRIYHKCVCHLQKYGYERCKAWIHDCICKCDHISYSIYCKALEHKCSCSAANNFKCKVDEHDCICLHDIIWHYYIPENYKSIQYEMPYKCKANVHPCICPYTYHVPEIMIYNPCKSVDHECMCYIDHSQSGKYQNKNIYCIAKTHKCLCQWSKNYDSLHILYCPVHNIRITNHNNVSYTPSKYDITVNSSQISNAYIKKMP